MLRCAGDEDRATQSRRRAALSRALCGGEHVTVDLSELVFADSSLMLDLVMLARRLRERGRTMRLRRPQPQILRLIELLGVHRLPGVAVEGPAVGGPAVGGPAVGGPNGLASRAHRVGRGSPARRTAA